MTSKEVPLVEHKSVNVAERMRVYSEEKREANQFIHRYLTLRITALFSIVAFLAAVMAFGGGFPDKRNIGINLVRGVTTFILWGTFFAAKSLEQIFAKRYHVAIEEARRCENMLIGEGLHYRIRAREKGKGLNERLFGYVFKVIASILVFITVIEGLYQLGLLDS